jgi:16S rRNA processing protein RimM
VRAPEPRYLVIGRVLRPHGVRGELRVEVLTGFPEQAGRHKQLFLARSDAPDDPVRHPVEYVRMHGRVLLLKLAGCNDRDAADELRGLLVEIPREEAVPLAAGELYQYQVVGLRVETEDGAWLGQVIEVLETGANDVYVVIGPFGEVLLPATAEVVRSVDLKEGLMRVHLLPGLLDDQHAP